MSGGKKTKRFGFRADRTIPMLDADQKEEYFYGRALTYVDDLTVAWRNMALDADEAWKSGEGLALGIYSQMWGRSAQNMAKAVRLFPEWFEPKREASAEEMIVLFTICQLGERKAQQLYKEWREHSTWRVWEVQAKVNELKARAARGTNDIVLARAFARRVKRRSVLVKSRTDVPPVQDEYDVVLRQPQSKLKRQPPAPTPKSASSGDSATRSSGKKKGAGKTSGGKRPTPSARGSTL